MAATAAPVPKEKEKEKTHEGKSIDSGSFGVFQNGHRVGTETFSIYQVSGGSVIHSEFKTENTPPEAQTSDMELNEKGEIRRYEWKELSPGSAHYIVLPNADFLNQKWSAGREIKSTKSLTCCRRPPASSTTISSSIVKCWLGNFWVWSASRTKGCCNAP